MRFVSILPLLLIIRVSFTSPVYSQAENLFDPLKDDISNIIPPLSVLLDSATSHNPYVQFRNLQLIVNDCKLRAKQVEWTRNLGIQANVGYGNLYNYSTNTSSDVVNQASIATSRSQTQYNGFIYLNMPFNTLIDRRNQINLAKTEIEQAQRMAEVQRDETRQLVIRQYNDLLLKQRLLRIKSKYLETARINLQMVEKEFSNGVTLVTEYSRIYQIFTFAATEYETTNTDFLTDYMILEEIVGMKFHLINQKSTRDDSH